MTKADIKWPPHQAWYSRVWLWFVERTVRPSG